MLARRRVHEREIPGFPQYFATVDGKIVSRKQGPPRELSPRAHHRTGHLRVRLYSKASPLREERAMGHRGKERIRRSRYTDVYVHVAVCIAWHGPPPFEGALVLHRDDDPNNNRPANLRWGSASENMKDRHMDDDEQRAAAEAAWAEFDPSAPDDDGFDWSTGEWR